MPDHDEIREQLGEILARAKQGKNIEALSEEAADLVNEWIDDAVADESGLR